MQIEFRLSNKGKIKIDADPLARMLHYQQKGKEDTEAGGVLLGRLIKDSKDIVIDHVSVPMIGDKRTRFSFIRNKKMHQRIIDSEWEKSKGTCNYIGEWHTHPEEYPTPSSIDLSNWKLRLKDDIFTSRYLYFVIVGLKETSAWEGDKRTFKIIKLKKLN
jgi:integrative and conjugative element protein (TIGR02256 family)